VKKLGPQAVGLGLPQQDAVIVDAAPLPQLLSPVICGARSLGADQIAATHE
jgi:hypothetical protein